MAVVGLEMTSYTTREDSVMIEVCARVLDPELECPIWFPFNISFTIADGSAGIIVNLKVLCTVEKWVFCMYVLINISMGAR